VSDYQWWTLEPYDWRMAMVELILLEGFDDPEGNRLLDRFEEHTGLEGDPLRDSHSRVYPMSADTPQGVEDFVSDVFENRLSPSEHAGVTTSTSEPKVGAETPNIGDSSTNQNRRTLQKCVGQCVGFSSAVIRKAPRLTLT
jgi:hypothetical protein